ALAIRAEQTTGFVNVLTFTNARQHIMQFLVLGTRVTNAVRGDERQSHAAREVDECEIAMRLIATPMTLQLDVRFAGKDARDFVQQRLGILNAARGERPRERAFIAAGQASQSLRVLFDQLPRVRRRPFRSRHRAGGNQPAEILIAGAILDEQRDARVVVIDDELRSNERANAGLLRRAVKTRRAVNAVRVDERHRRYAARGGVIDEILGQTRAVEKRECGCGAQLRVRPRAIGQLRPAAFARLLLARAGGAMRGLERFVGSGIAHGRQSSSASSSMRRTPMTSTSARISTALLCGTM